MSFRLIRPILYYKISYIWIFDYCDLRYIKKHHAVACSLREAHIIYCIFCMPCMLTYSHKCDDKKAILMFYNCRPCNTSKMSLLLFLVFRIHGILRWIQIRILGSVQWITYPDPDLDLEPAAALYVSCFRDANKNIFTRFFAHNLL